MSREANWLIDLRSIQKTLVKVLREAFREDFPQAVAMLGVTNTRLATQLAQLNADEIDRLVAALGPRLLVRLDDSLALEHLVSRVLDGADEVEVGMARMAAAATTSEAQI